MGSVAISQQYATGYKNGITYADGRVNTSSASYSAGITYADGRVNTSSSNYIGGYNAGITYADGRVNTSSASYTNGYNTGYAAKTMKIVYLGSVGAGGSASFTLPVSGLTSDNIYFKGVSASGSGTSRDNRWYGFGGTGGSISISVSGTTCSVSSSKPSVQDNGTAQLSVGVNAGVYCVYAT
jgi:hypothetical protein